MDLIISGVAFKIEKSDDFDWSGLKLNRPFKGSLDPSHFIFEINVGKRRIRHRTTLKLNCQINSKSI